MAPPLYRSQTRLCALANLPTTLRNALITHADAKHLNLDPSLLSLSAEYRF